MSPVATPGFAPAMYAAALAGLPGCGPARLAALLGAWGPQEAYERVASGAAYGHAGIRSVFGRDERPLLGRWMALLARRGVGVEAARLERAGVAVLTMDDPSYPAALRDDPDPPAVLFYRGRPDVARARRVAIVGTRRCTAYGRQVAHRLGAELTAAGVVVVSGLARGIDGAAHEGVIEAGGTPLGIVGSGLDVIYPRSHAGLWQAVARHGLLLSEAPLGAAPEPWRFPARNRIIAGLAELVIVVESHDAGGSQHTVDSAIARGVPVMAVPGPVSSAASSGSNRLLVDGAGPVLGAGEVLVALGLDHSRCVIPPPPPGSRLTADERAVLDRLDFAPTATENLLTLTGLSTGRLAVALAGLENAGLAGGHGGWWERRGQ